MTYDELKHSGIDLVDGQVWWITTNTISTPFVVQACEITRNNFCYMVDFYENMYYIEDDDINFIQLVEPPQI